jgi:hypothetical protein
MVAPVEIEWDKKSVADGGKVRIVAYDPFAKNGEWTAAAADGNTYTGAEVTSEGFQIFGLPPYQYYSAGIACYMSNQQWLQDNHDHWNNHMDLAGITNRGIVGFKYFGFGGLAKADRGVNAFGGTKKGDGTQLNLNLTPSGKGAFKIRVMLDGPYANTTWKGREIAVLDIPADAPQQAKTYTVAVPAVEGLKGKHAIYLVVEGPEVQQSQQPQRGGRPQQPQRPQGLFDLHGIGFSKGAGLIAKLPPVPTVTITVDGKAINLPSAPMYATNDNGYMESTNYQAYAPLKANSVIRATASDPSVQIVVGNITDGRATVKATYKGQTKTYFIN